MKTEKLVQVHIFFIFYGFKYLCILSRRFAYLHRGSIPTSSIYVSYPESLLISIPSSFGPFWLQHMKRPLACENARTDKINLTHTYVLVCTVILAASDP